MSNRWFPNPKNRYGKVIEVMWLPTGYNIRWKSLRPSHMGNMASAGRNGWRVVLPHNPSGGTSHSETCYDR
jgi:hypothetical protein